MKIRITILFIFISVFTFAQTAGYDLNSIVVTSGATNPIANISPITEDKQPTDSTLDIVNWNLSFFGAPSSSSKFKSLSRDVQIDSVAKKLVEIDADVYALQEVVVDSYNGNALTDLVAKMNKLAGSDEYGGSYSPYHSLYWTTDDEDYPSQCLAYVWKKATVSVNKDSALLIDEAGYSDFAYKRLPYMLDANVTFRGKTQRYIFINIHLKASTGYSEDRASSMELLHKLLTVNFSENNVVLLGDYNVADAPGAIGEIKDWGMYEDREVDGLTDYVHVAGDKEDGIEHILISDELYDELAYISEWDWNVTVKNTKNYSDHYAYMTSLYVYEESGNVDPGNNSINNDGKYAFTMSTSDYQIVVDYSNENKLNTETDYPDNTDSYFGASSYYPDFDIRSGSYSSTFSTWQEAVQAGISMALLPEKYPDATASDTVYYSVTFDTYNGSTPYVEYTFSFTCTKSAPNPVFAYYSNSSNKVVSRASAISLYPNPASDVLAVTSSAGVAKVSCFDLTGKEALIYLPNGEKTFSVDLSALRSGLYIVQAITNEGAIQVSKFIKK